MGVVLEGIDEAAESAAEMMPIIMRALEPKTVLDVGCRDGVFLEEALRAGAKTVVGLDRDEPEIYQVLRIGRSHYYGLDFENDPYPQFEERFDLVLCLEVAEHLPNTAGWNLVRYLTNVAKLILWSAAVPGQGGQGHINEQWPSYWHFRFAEAGWHPDGTLRSLLWDNQAIQPYYRQNLMLYKPHRVRMAGFIEDAVHPDLWTYKMKIKTRRIG